MSTARVDSEWNHTAALLAQIANAHRDPKKGRAHKPDDYHPMRAKRSSSSGGIPITKKNIGMLKKLFIKNRGRHGRVGQ